ncbi:hypothetical protein LguiB_025514 [Lonicera macranthoides]
MKRVTNETVEIVVEQENFANFSDSGNDLDFNNNDYNDLTYDYKMLSKYVDKNVEWGGVEDKVPPPSSKPAKSKGGKQKMKKWSKGKQKDKVNNMVLFDKTTYDKLLSEATKSISCNKYNF